MLAVIKVTLAKPPLSHSPISVHHCLVTNKACRVYRLHLVSSKACLDSSSSECFSALDPVASKCLWDWNEGSILLWSCPCFFFSIISRIFVTSTGVNQIWSWLLLWVVGSYLLLNTIFHRLYSVVLPIVLCNKFPCYLCSFYCSYGQSRSPFNEVPHDTLLWVKDPIVTTRGLTARYIWGHAIFNNALKRHSSKAKAPKERGLFFTRWSV